MPSSERPQIAKADASDVASRQPPLPRTPDPQSGSVEPEKILVVDDDFDLRRMTVRALARAGYDVASSPDGEDGWRLLRSEFFQLLITDHNMPRMTGLELIGRARIARMTLPAILVSASANDVDPGADQALRISCRIAKPFSMQELLAAVQAALGASQRNRPVQPGRWEHHSPSPQHGWGINE